MIRCAVPRFDGRCGLLVSRARDPTVVWGMQAGVRTDVHRRCVSMSKSNSVDNGACVGIPLLRPAGGL